MARNTIYYLVQPGGFNPPPPPGGAPVNTVSPSISINPFVNTQVNGVRGTWTDATSYADQWEASNDGVIGWFNISGATSINYTPTPFYYQLYLRRKETATGPGGSTVAYSNVVGPVALPAMTFTITTTGAGQTLTLQEIRTVIGQQINIDWGDGSNNNYTSTGSTGNTRTHVYAVANTYVVTIDLPDRVTHFDVRDTKIIQLLGTQLSLMRLLTNLRILSVPNTALVWTVGTAAPMMPALQYLQIELQNNFVWTVNFDFPPINDVLNLRGLPSMVWLIDSDNPMPSEVESLTIREVPGITYQSSMEDVPDLSTVRIENGWSQAQVDAWLLDVYAAFPSRTVAGGTIDLLGGSPANAAPSGVLAAMCPPTTGKAAAYELVNDSCGVSANHWTTITTA